MASKVCGPVFDDQIGFVPDRRWKKKVEKRWRMEEKEGERRRKSVEELPPIKY